MIERRSLIQSSWKESWGSNAEGATIDLRKPQHRCAPACRIGLLQKRVVDEIFLKGLFLSESRIRRWTILELLLNFHKAQYHSRF
jgi:hypothetical protein